MLKCKTLAIEINYIIPILLNYMIIPLDTKVSFVMSITIQSNILDT